MSFKEKLYLVATEMLKWGDPAEANGMYLDFEDGRKLYVEVDSAGSVWVTGILPSTERRPARTTDPMYVGTQHDEPIELGDSISKAIGPYTEAFEKRAGHQQEEKKAQHLQGGRLREIANHLGLGVGFMAKGLSVMLPYNGYVIASDEGFTIHMTVDLPPDQIARALDILLGREGTDRTVTT